MTTRTRTIGVMTMTMRTSKLSSSAHSALSLGGGWSSFGSAAVLGLALIAPTHLLHAQAKPAVRHSVDGTVVNAANAPVAGAVVYLENPRSLDIRSYLTDDQGHYHFEQISPQTDYEVWAEQNGIQSKHKFISQFSSHVNFHFQLKLAPQKKKFLGIF
jgi:protocatechuate 3,4-dioxygenase beta subunit